MRVMALERTGTPLVLREWPIPSPGEGEVRLRVEACGVCRTDLHIIDGELSAPTLPIVPGHEIVGRVDAVGAGVTQVALGDRVGVPWLAGICGSCTFCRTGRENLCDAPRFTGLHRHGGYAEWTVADERVCYALPSDADAASLAPWLCAGLIGYRALAMTGQARSLALYGFGAAAHIVTQIAVFEGRRVFALTRPGDSEGQAFARSLGAEWAGDSTQPTPTPVEAAIIFAPVGPLVPAALRVVDKGGTVVCAGIHMSDIPAFPYALLWGERTVRSVANLTLADGRQFLSLAPRVPVRTATETFPLSRANDAVEAVRAGRIRGAAVLVPGT